VRVLSWRTADWKTAKSSKSVNSDSSTCALTWATWRQLITSRRCSMARAPPALPWPTNPTALLVHSVPAHTMDEFCWCRTGFPGPQISAWRSLPVRVRFQGSAALASVQVELVGECCDARGAEKGAHDVPGHPRDFELVASTGQRWLTTFTTVPSGSRTKKRRTPHSSSESGWMISAPVARTAS
jgi:hypothetical protein